MGDIDVFDSLIGATEAYNRAHVTARIELMNRILRQESYQRLWRDWAERLGFLDTILTSKRAWRRLRTLLGDKTYNRFREHMEHENDGTFTFEVDSEDTEAISVEVNSLIRVIGEAVDIYHTRVNDAGQWSDDFADAVIDFVKNDLHLPWAWVGNELIEVFYMSVQAELSDAQVTKEVGVIPKIPSAPEKPFVLNPISGETEEEWLYRLNSEGATFAAETQSASGGMALPIGQRRNPERIAEQVEWMFRNRVLGESIRSICRHEADGTLRTQANDRSQVKYGIAQAVGLLGVTGQFWNDASEDDIAPAERYWASPDNEGEG